MPALVPRPYQAKAIEDIRGAFAGGSKRVVFVLPTGGGKSAVASMIGAGLYRNSKKALYLGHRIEIVEQLGGAVRNASVPFSFLTAGTFGMPTSQIIVGSIGTVSSRKHRLAWQPDLIFVDECHHAMAKTWRDLIEHFPNAKVVGLTATPCRLDGRGLGELFDTMIEGPHTDELIRDGFLCDFVAYAPSAPNLSGVHVRGGDYVNKELEDAMRKAAITGDAVKHYAKLAHDKSAVVFCVSVAHAEEVAGKFRDAGYDFRSIDGKMQSSQRRQLIDMMTKGQIHGLTSCDIISEGTDIPRIECAILLRPTKSLGLYKQQVGRGLRPFPGKDKLIILDHAGNVHVHGLPDARIEWSLDGGAKRGGAGEKIAAVRTCIKCFAVHKPAPVCPRCGYVYEVKSRKLEYRDGELEEVNRIAGVDGTGKPKSYWEQARQSLEAVAASKGYKKGWVDHVLAARQEAERKKIAEQIGEGFRSG